MADSALTAALQAIRDRAGVVAKLGPPRPGGDLINAAHRSAADVPRLVAALEAVLRLADELDVPPYFLDDVTAARRGVALRFREAIISALTGQEAPDGR